MIEVGVAALCDGNRFIDAGAVGIASLQRVRPVVFEENVFAIVDIALRLAIGHLFDPSP